jgi:hypothetical protein
MKFLAVILLLINLNCITLVGIKIGNVLTEKSKNAESIIQITGFIGLLGDGYISTLVQPPQVGLAYGILSFLFYILTDGGISDRIGRNEGLVEEE